MMLIQFLSLLMWLGICPLYIGALLIKNHRTDYNSLFMAYLSGIICMFAAFQIIAIPMIFLNMSLDTVMYTWCGAVVIITAVSIYKNRTLEEIRKETYRTIKTFDVGMVMVFLIVCVQIFLFAYTQHFEGDDSFYLGTAAAAWDSNTMFKIDPYTGDPYVGFPARYVLAPLPILYAILGKLLSMHPVIVAHTLLPFILIPMAYMVLYLIGKHLFPGKKRAIMLFMLFIAVLHSFGYFSVYSVSSFLLLRIWQGKAMIANIILPFTFLLMIKVMKEEGKKNEWFLLLLTAFAACMVSSMGVFLIPLFLGCFGLSYAFARKNIRILMYTVVCLIPNVIYGLIYLFIG